MAAGGRRRPRRRCRTSRSSWCPATRGTAPAARGRSRPQDASCSLPVETVHGPPSCWSSGSGPARTSGSPPRSTRGAGRGRPRRRLRAVRQPGAAAGRPDPARVAATPSSWTGPGSRSTWPCAGERVAVVSGGDAGVFGMASAVFEAAEDPAYADVRDPGAARASARCRPWPRGPVRRSAATSRCVSLSDRLKPWSVIEQRLRAIAEADLVLAIYNPASRSRHRAGRARPRSCCSSTVRPTPSWSSAATSAARRSR